MFRAHVRDYFYPLTSWEPSLSHTSISLRQWPDIDVSEELTLNLQHKIMTNAFTTVGQALYRSILPLYIFITIGFITEAGKVIFHPFLHG